MMKKLISAGTLCLAASLISATSLSAMPFGQRHTGVSERSDVILAQSANTELRVQQLEEQLRLLTGKVEDMTFQLLQMQEQLRKAQEDNEFRFQELEGGKKKSSLETVPGANDASQDTASGIEPGADTTARAQNEQPMDMAHEDSDITARSSDTGLPPTDLGSLEFDQNGNVVGARGEDPDAVAESDLPPPSTDNNDQTASLGNPADNDQYQSAYEQILSGDYAAAEQGFSGFIQSNPDSKKAADAHFWLGEAQYSQGKYNESAKTFLNAYKTYNKSPKAPEILLKLAMSLAALESKDTACATLREVTKTYPKASRAVISKVASEQKRLAC